MDHYWPSLLVPASSRLEILSSAGRFQSPLSGVTRTITRPGERMRLTLSFQNTNSAMRAAVQYAIARMQGATHRIWAHDHSNRIRGSFPATELLTNNTFANGTTGWAPIASTYAATVSDRVYRATAIKNSDASADLITLTGGTTVTQYRPLCIRMMLGGGNLAGNVSLGARLNGSSTAQDFQNDAPLANELRTMAFTPIVTNIGPVLNSGVISNLAGQFVDIPFVSMAHCALVDNGPNLLLRSQDLFTTWTKNSCDLPTSNNTDVSPDGTTSAETIKDTVATAEHFLNQNVTVSSAAADFSASCYFKASSGNWGYLRVIESIGGTSTFSFINSSSGALGTSGVGANWSNVRVTTTNVGNGWFRLTVTARKTNAATTLEIRVGVSNADNVFSYLGSGLQLAIWGASLAQSSVPVRYVATTTAAVAATAQAASGPLHTKGWPASTNGLLLPGDQVQIGNQIHIVTASVNSDAAGLATLECYPARRSAPADNAPIVINQPMAKFFLESDANGWGNKPGIFSDAEIVLAEAS